MRILVCIVALVSAGACGSSDGAPPAAPPVTPAPASNERSAVEVHEWGLIDVAGGAAELSAGPGRPPRPMQMRKPVLYLHLRDAESARVSVTARVPGGSILEHWPAGQISDGAIAWPSVGVRRGVCGARDRRWAAQPCGSTDGYCETSELPGYVTDDHDCLDVGGAEASLLFYRASVRPDALPLEVAVDGDLRVTARRSMAGAPGSLVRVTRVDGTLRVARAPLPDAGETRTVSIGEEALNAPAEREAMARDLAALGMTPAEARAFVDAWSAALFEGVASRGPSREARRARVPTGPNDVLLYWMPEDAVAALASLDVQPPPLALRRAFMVRVELAH